MTSFKATRLLQLGVNHDTTFINKSISSIYVNLGLISTLSFNWGKKVQKSNYRYNFTQTVCYTHKRLNWIIQLFNYINSSSQLASPVSHRRKYREEPQSTSDYFDLETLKQIRGEDQCLSLTPQEAGKPAQPSLLEKRGREGRIESPPQSASGQALAREPSHWGSTEHPL